MRALVEFIEKYRPGFSKEIIPANELSIAVLEDLAGPLPGAYRRFLQTMGESMGDLDLAEANFSLRGITAVYIAKSWLRLGRYIRVAEDEGLDGWDWFLDRSRPHGVDDCMLVRRLLSENYPPEGSHPKHVSLEEFLYYAAFKELRLPLLPYQRKFSSPEDPAAAVRYRADLVSALAEEKGFQRIPPAERCALYERGDAALLLYQHPIEPFFSFTLGCEDPAEMERLARDFEEQTELKGVVVK
jgi:hypothetical protein